MSPGATGTPVPEFPRTKAGKMVVTDVETAVSRMVHEANVAERASMARALLTLVKSGVTLAENEARGRNAL